MKLEIKLLEYQIIALENEKSDAANKIFEYDRLFNEILGETVRQYLELKRILKKQAAKESPENETAQKEYEEAQTDYREFKESYEETKQQAEDFKKINFEDAVTLGKAYHEAVVLCHPDKHVNDLEKYKKSEQLFKELNDAYRKQDIEKVKSILNNLKQGIFDFNETNTKTNDIKLLKNILDQLQKKYELLFEYIKNIKKSDAYTVILKEDNLHTYFTRMKDDIDRQINELKNQVKVYEQ